MPTLRLRHADGKEAVHPLDRDILTFGRAPDNDVVLDARGVSRRHGRFVRDDEGRWHVEDLGSTNGILVSGRYITRHLLRPNDAITVGEMALMFQADAPAACSLVTQAVTICEIPAGPSTVEQSAVTMGAMDRQRLTALYEISKRLMDQRDVSGLVDEASSALISNLEAEVVVFGLTRDPEHERDQLVVRSAAGRQTDVTLSGSVLRRTIDARRAILVADTSTDDDLVQAHSIVEGGISSALCVPMMRRDQVTGFIYIDSRRRRRSYCPADLEFACAVGAVVATAVENARLLESEFAKQRMEAELASARRVQQAILPSAWPSLDLWEVFGTHETCREVGGDYYDAVVTADRRLWLVVADVTGKGAPAALLASAVHASIQALVDQCPTPASLLTRLNDLLLRRDMDQGLVTCLVVMLPLDSGDAMIASAGHPYPIYLEEGGSAHSVNMKNGLLLGVEHTSPYTDTPWVFPSAGGALLMYTDGVTEALNAHKEQLGEDRLLAVLSQRESSSPREVIRDVRSAVADFRGQCPSSDDLTLLACARRHPAGTTAG